MRRAYVFARHGVLLEPRQARRPCQASVLRAITILLAYDIAIALLDVATFLAFSIGAATGIVLAP
jgi:hypothetical protein